MTDDEIRKRAEEVLDFFRRKASRVDALAEERWDQEVTILATTALDSLGAVWFCDFPERKMALQKELGGAVPSSIRMSRLMRTFAGQDAEAQKVAVVCFAEDLRRYKPELTGLASTLLAPRVPSREPGALSFGELPYSHLDKNPRDLLDECPEIRRHAELEKIIEEYTYPALLYRFFRCPLVHMASRAKRTHGFAIKREVMYMPIHPNDFTSISFGPQLLTDWIRSAAAGYVDACVADGRQPAGDVDAGADVEANLERRWEKVGN